MESVLGRYRNLTILVGVLFLQVLGLAVQVKRSADAESTRLIRIWAVDVITLWHNYFFLRGVRAENRQLKDQIEQMRLQQVRLSEDATQAHRLQSLLAFKEQFIAKTVAAQVIGSSGSDLSRSIYIDKGDNAGLKPDMAVITAGGIVGKVWIVYPSTSLVLMINDQSSGVGAMSEKSRLQGVVRGTPNGELVMDRVMSDETVTPGETLLSSGGDRIFPKGLPVGTVSKVSPGHEMFLNIQVKPAADLGRVEEVLVVTEKQDREPVAEGAVNMRAADILAQRLPSVPPKPVVTAGAAGNAFAGGGHNSASAGAPAGTAEVAKNGEKKNSVNDSATHATNKGGSSSAVAAGTANSALNSPNGIPTPTVPKPAAKASANSASPSPKPASVPPKAPSPSSNPPSTANADHPH